MKYSEVIEKIEKFKLDFSYGNVEEIEDDDPFEIHDKQIPYMEKLLDQLFKADNLNITHDEYFDIDEGMLNGQNIYELEELLIKKKNFLENLERSDGRYGLVYSPISRDRSIKMQYKVSKIILLLKNELKKRDQIEAPEKQLTLTKKIALLKELGFFDLEKLSGDDSFKAKITQLITGGSIDSISRNLKNFNLPDDKRDYKYSSFQYSEESKKMISKAKSHTREK